MLPLKPTGDMYKPNCTRKGTTWRKSRYRTFSAESQSPAPNAAPNASPINTGKAKIRQSGQNRFQSINIASKQSVIRKSAKLVMTDPAGITSRGKYTFEIRFALPIRLLLDSVRAVAKNC